jgi:hypothetical protein
VWQQHSVRDLTLTVFGSGVGVYWDNAWLDN